jgi:hypothetical protein
MPCLAYARDSPRCAHDRKLVDTPLICPWKTAPGFGPPRLLGMEYSKRYRTQYVSTANHIFPNWDVIGEKNRPTRCGAGPTR